MKLDIICLTIEVQRVGYVARLKRLDWSDNSREYTKTNDSKYVLIVWLAAVDCRDAQTLLTTCESSQRPKTRAKDCHDIRYTRNSPEKGTHTHPGLRRVLEASARHAEDGLGWLIWRPTPAGF